jgi:hypothetical protein
MLAFGVCIGSDERFATIALPSIEAVSSKVRSCVITRRNMSSIYTAYNEILDEAAGLPDLEALVLMHDDVELRDSRLADRLKDAFAAPDVGLLGGIGARSVTSLAWWEGQRAGRASWNGPAGSAGPVIDDFGFENPRVDAVDGMLMALSPWVVDHVRFDAGRFTGFHGYDVDYCFEVRRRGKHVQVIPFDLHHHDRRAGFPDRLGWERTNIRWRAKWGFIPRWSIAPRLTWLQAQSKYSSVVNRLWR